jgi:hypothetical protein
MIRTGACCLQRLGIEGSINSWGLMLWGNIGTYLVSVDSNLVHVDTVEILLDSSVCTCCITDEDLEGRELVEIEAAMVAENIIRNWAGEAAYTTLT